MSVTRDASRRIGACAEARGRDALLVAARRVDWRFLLPDPAPKRVALIGRADEPLRHALATFCSAPKQWPEPPQAAELAGQFDLVVVASGHGEGVGAAARLVAPGGTLRWEARGKPSARVMEARLREAELEDVVVHWHRPTFEAGLEAIPLAAPRVMDHVLQPGTHGRAGERRRSVARWLRRLGLLGLIAPCRAAMGRRGAALEAGLPDRLRHLAAAYGGGSPDRVVILLRTPRFRASGHVLLFGFPQHSATPSLLAKIARVPGSAPSLGREAASLEALAALPGGGVEGVPRLVERRDVGGCAAILETIVRGIPVHPERLRAEPDAHVLPFVDWTAELHRRTCTDAVASNWWEQAVDRPLRRIESLFGEGSEEAAMAARTREVTAGLREGGAVWVYEHGDLSGPNLLLDRGRPAVVDWELGTPHGVLASDLFLLLGFAVFARDRAATGPAARAALRGAFYGGEPWASRWVQRYAERVGLEASRLPALYVLAWARNVASYVERLDADRDALDATGDLRAWLRRERAFAAWEDALDGFTELRPAGRGEVP